MNTEREFVKHLQDLHKNNSLIKVAVANGRDYVTPEDIEIAQKSTNLVVLMKDALQVLGDNTGYGVEDRRLFAQLAAQVMDGDDKLRLDDGLFDRLALWLSTEYSLEEAIEQLQKATFEWKGDKTKVLSIKYENGAQDIVQIEDDKIIHLNPK